jgi:hypothetical protein
MIGVAAVALAACGNDEPDTAGALTRAQKDSIVAELPVPGAGAVGRAMEARDQANARSAEHDAIR